MLMLLLHRCCCSFSPLSLSHCDIHFSFSPFCRCPRLRRCFLSSFCSLPFVILCFFLISSSLHCAYVRSPSYTLYLLLLLFCLLLAAGCWPLAVIISIQSIITQLFVIRHLYLSSLPPCLPVSSSPPPTPPPQRKPHQTTPAADESTSPPPHSSST